MCTKNQPCEKLHKAQQSGTIASRQQSLSRTRTLIRMSSEEKTVSIVFTNRNDRDSIPVTGAFGGPTPDGLAIVAHLYIEHGTVPSMVTHPIEDDGTVDFKTIHPVTRGDVTREVQATIVLAPEHARSLGVWLAGHANAALKKRKEQ